YFTNCPKPAGTDATSSASKPQRISASGNLSIRDECNCHKPPSYLATPSLFLTLHSLASLHGPVNHNMNVLPHGSPEFLALPHQTSAIFLNICENFAVMCILF